MAVVRYSSRKVTCPTCGGTATVLESYGDEQSVWQIDDALCAVCGPVDLDQVPPRAPQQDD